MLPLDVGAPGARAGRAHGRHARAARVAWAAAGLVPARTRLLRPGVVALALLLAADLLSRPALAPTRAPSDARVWEAAADLDFLQSLGSARPDVWAVARARAVARRWRTVFWRKPGLDRWVATRCRHLAAEHGPLVDRAMAP
jgi:hypothetical protein